MSAYQQLLTSPRVRGLFLPALLVVVWEASGRADLLPNYIVAPSAILQSFSTMLVNGEIYSHTRDSLYRASTGLLIGSFSGVTMGLLAGVFRPIENFYDPIISLTYPVPKIAILPILFAWLGIGNLSKITIITIAVFYPMFIAAFYGAKSVSKVHVWSARNMGATRSNIFWKIIVPTALPQIFTGLRVALALSLVVMIAAELVVSNTGLGFLVVQAEAGLRFDIMYVAIVVTAFIGFLSDRALLIARRRVLRGQLVATAERDE
jgi:ABC-type nitrate/sulfonate/bicarbonate transport system permease component